MTTVLFTLLGVVSKSVVSICWGTVLVTVLTTHPAATEDSGMPVSANPAVMAGSSDPTASVVETGTDVACDIACTVGGDIVTAVSDPAGTVVVPSAWDPAVTVADVEVTLAD